MATTPHSAEELPPTEALTCASRIGPSLRAFGLLVVVESLTHLQTVRAAELCDEGRFVEATEALSCAKLLQRLAATIPGSRAQVAKCRRELEFVTKIVKGREKQHAEEI